MKVAKVLKKSYVLAGFGFFLGLLTILVIRFATYNPHRVHYHANFAVFINGQREQFKDNFYYQSEGAACIADANMTPTDRAHMHDHINDLVHVHDHAVTWGQFFQNIGWGVNPRFINTPTQLLVASENQKVTFWVNGQEVANIANQVIGDRDKLLVDFGTDNNLQAEYKTIPSTAAKNDTDKDPASCSGSTPVTTHERLSHLF